MKFLYLACSNAVYFTVLVASRAALVPYHYRGLAALGQDVVYGAVVCWTMPVLVGAMFAHLLSGLRGAYGPRPTPRRALVLLGLALLGNAWLVTNWFGLLGGAYHAAAVGKAAVDAGVFWRWWGPATAAESTTHPGEGNAS
jgi:hypothetical protein